MSLFLAVNLAFVLALLTYITVARLFLIPAMKTWRLSTVLIVLLLPHTFRFVALSTFAAVEFGAVQANVEEIAMTAYGDTASAVVSLIAIWIVAAGAKIARFAIWGAALFGLIDLGIALPQAMISGLASQVSGTTWWVVVFLVPALLVSYALLFWQLLARRDEPIEAKARS